MKVLVLALTVLLPGLALAQAPPPAPPPPPPLWSGKAELSFVSTSGNTDTMTLGFGAEVGFKPDPWDVAFKAAFVRAESDGDLKARSLDLALRAGYRLSPRVEVFDICGYFENRFAGIDHRFNEDLGVAYLVLPEGPHKLKVEAGMGYTKEWRISAEDRSFATARAALGYKWAFSKTAEFSEDFAYVADLKTSKNWRVQNVASVSATLTSLLSLKVSHALNFLNEPSPGFRKTDTVTAAAVVAKF